MAQSSRAEETKGEEEAIRAARILGASIGSFLSAVLATAPQVLSQVAAEEGQNELAKWALEVNQAVGRTLTRTLPPAEVEKLVESLASAIKSFTYVAIELANTIGDPQVAEVIRRAAEGFRKGLTTASLQDPVSLMRMMTDPDVAYAVSVILAALKALGVAMRVSSETKGQVA